MKIISLSENYELLTEQKPIIKIGAERYYVLNQPLIKYIKQQISNSILTNSCYRIVGEIDNDIVNINDTITGKNLVFDIKNFLPYRYEGVI